VLDGAVSTLGSLQLGLPESWLPDETLFSLCSRYHRASGNRLSSTTCRLLFGHPRQGCAHDFPARLDYLLSVAGDALGSTDSIVEQRTVLPLYLRFASQNLIDAALSAAAQGSSGGLKFQLGLLTSRFRANHPLKACRDCIVEDAQNHATPYWHREHQLPGIWVCRRHGGWLQASGLKATGTSRFHWVLPSFDQLELPPAAEPASSVRRLADMVAGAVGEPGVALAVPAMPAAFRAALARKGLLTGPTQRLRHTASGDAYASFTAPLLEVEQLSGLPGSSEKASAEIAKQIAGEPYRMHPIRRLALAAWLFKDLDELLAEIALVSEPPKRVGRSPSPADQAALDPRRDGFLALLAARRSTSAAAKETGIDTATGMAWAAAAGIATPRRPKSLKGDARTRLIALLRKGVSKAEAASHAKVSIQTVTTLLRTEVGLHVAWKQAGFESARRYNRRRWERIASANPLSGVKAARMAEPAVYAWLYRNDRDWLGEMVANMARAVRVPKMRVDWDARDRQLADQVRSIALQLVEREGAKRIRLHHLCQRIPELKAKVSKLDRLPLTRTAIFAAVGRASESERPID
jgi:Tn7-like transposition protein D/TniQ